MAWTVPAPSGFGHPGPMEHCCGDAQNDYVLAWLYVSPISMYPYAVCEEAISAAGTGMCFHIQGEKDRRDGKTERQELFCLAGLLWLPLVHAVGYGYICESLSIPLSIPMEA